MADTLALGRSKRSTAGNRMRELLEKAHQEDDDDIFREVEDDEEFAAPQETRDVFLEDFADTDDEVEVDEEEQERLMRREERRKAKGKSKAVYNPHIPTIKRPTAPSTQPLPFADNAIASSSKLDLLDPLLDPENMAPSTLVLALRKQRREAKRAGRSETRRSNLRASTLKTEEDILAKERQVKENPSKKGRKAQHEGGEVRGIRAMTQDELIASALEEEERNKESLRDWLSKEEARRELRRVGRKRVKGPRWTWVSRTVGKAVEVVEEVQEVNAEEDKRVEGIETEKITLPSTPLDAISQTANSATPTIEKTSTQPPTGISNPPNSTSIFQPPLMIPSPLMATSQPTPDTIPEPTAPDLPYTRNYLILSQVPGGLPAEFSLILGSHTDWNSTKHVPARNRPLTRRPPLCPFTGLPAKYRHPGTGVQYATLEGYKIIDSMLREEYVWNDEAGWTGREDEELGVEGVEGWVEAVVGGWMGGKRIREDGGDEDQSGEKGDVEMEVEDEIVVEIEAPLPKKRGRKRKSEVAVVL